MPAAGHPRNGYLPRPQAVNRAEVEQALLRNAADLYGGSPGIRQLALARCMTAIDAYAALGATQSVPQPEPRPMTPARTRKPAQRRTAPRGTKADTITPTTRRKATR